LTGWFPVGDPGEKRKRAMSDVLRLKKVQFYFGICSHFLTEERARRKKQFSRRKSARDEKSENRNEYEERRKKELQELPRNIGKVGENIWTGEETCWVVALKLNRKMTEAGTSRGARKRNRGPKGRGGGKGNSTSSFASL